MTDWLVAAVLILTVAVAGTACIHMWDRRSLGPGWECHIENPHKPNYVEVCDRVKK